MNNWLNRIFGFSKKEQNGLVVLCVLVCIIVFLPTIYKACFPPDVYVVELPAGAPGQQVEKAAVAGSPETRKDHRTIAAPAMRRQLFPFNPNALSAADWRKLGLTDRQIQVIHNYESKGGTFRRKEDLKKMYSISDTKYLELEPYVRIPETAGPAYRQEHERTAQKVVKEKAPNRIIELNAADSAALVDVRGIGPVLASRILQYRNRLGGFRRVEQLREVYGIDSLRYSEIRGQLRADTTAVKKIYINRVSFDELKKFPYLRYKQMNAIIQYRKQHGRYSSAEDLTKINILDSEILRKIAPYLVFDD